MPRETGAHAGSSPGTCSSINALHSSNCFCIIRARVKGSSCGSHGGATAVDHLPLTYWEQPGRRGAAGTTLPQLTSVGK